MNERKKSEFGSIVLLIILAFLFMVGLPRINKDKGDSSIKDQIVNKDEIIKDEFSRKGALDVATEMLQEGYKLDVKLYVDKLLNGEKVEMPSSITDRYHIPKGNPHDSEMKELTDLSILVMIDTLKELDFEEVKVTNKYAEDLVYFDEEAKLASIPYHIYTGLPENTGFTIQLGYIDGEWKYLPYEQIQKMALATSIGMQEEENE